MDKSVSSRKCANLSLGFVLPELASFGLALLYLRGMGPTCAAGSDGRGCARVCGRLLRGDVAGIRFEVWEKGS